jgi:type-IV secretion system protein TraC
MLLTDGSISSGLSVGQIDIECFDAAQINSLTEMLRSLMNSVGEGVKMQWVLSIDSDFEKVISSHESGVKPDSASVLIDLEKYRTRKLREQMANGILYRPKLSIYLNVTPQGKSSTGIFSSHADFQQVTRTQVEDQLSELKEHLDSLLSALESVGLTARTLTKEEMIESAYRTLNPKHSRTEPAPALKLVADEQLEPETLEGSPWLAIPSPRGDLVFGDLILNLERFTLDSTLHAVVSLKTLPEVTYAGMVSGLLRLSFHYDLVMTVDVPPQSKEMGKLQAKRRMAHSMNMNNGGRATDLENESKLGATEELIRELLNTGQKIFAAELIIILRAPHGKEGEKELNRKIREVLSRVRTLNGAEALAESVGAWKIFKNILPGAPKELIRAKRMKTNNLVDFLPVYGPRLGDEKPKVLFSNRLGSLVSFDPFSSELPNYNALVTGVSGSGKSFLNNYILNQEIARGTRAFIIDIGGSYKKLTESLGGQYIEVNLTQEHSINPFHLDDPSKEPSSQKVKSLLAIMELMTAEDDTSKLPKLERVLLEKAILETYERARALCKVPQLSDLVKVCEASVEPALKNIGKMLFSWTGDRPYGVLLDQPGSLKTAGTICTFDLKGLSNWPDLQGVMILILTEFILSEVEKDLTKTKRIILDEAWALLKSPAAARFMEYCVRTLRKTGSGITFITQGVEEIVASPVGSAIIANTATKFIMLQRGDTKALQSAFKLNAQELSLVQSLEQKKGQFSEGFMIEGTHRQVVRIEPHPIEYWLSTSDSRDNQWLAKVMADKKLDLTAAIKFASDKYPFGLGQVREVDLCAA